MEHRRNGRKPISLDAVVGCSRFGLIRGRIVEVGPDELYIKADASLVPVGAEVTVTFQPGDGVCSDCLSVNGHISRQNAYGFGVALDAPGPRCREFLLRHLPVVPKARLRAVPELRAL